MIKPGTYTIVPVVRGEYTRWQVKRGWFTLGEDDLWPEVNHYGDAGNAEADSPELMIEILAARIWAAGRRLHRKRRQAQRAAAAKAAKPRAIRWP